LARAGQPGPPFLEDQRSLLDDSDEDELMDPDYSPKKYIPPFPTVRKSPRK